MGSMLMGGGDGVSGRVWVNEHTGFKTRKQKNNFLVPNRLLLYNFIWLSSLWTEKIKIKH